MWRSKAPNGRHALPILAHAAFRNRHVGLVLWTTWKRSWWEISPRQRYRVSSKGWQVRDCFWLKAVNLNGWWSVDGQIGELYCHGSIYSTRTNFFQRKLAESRLFASWLPVILSQCPLKRQVEECFLVNSDWSTFFLGAAVRCAPDICFPLIILRRKECHDDFIESPSGMGLSENRVYYGIFPMK